MTQQDQREGAIQNLVELLRRNPFSVEFKVKKKPAGIKVIYEVTQEFMDSMIRRAQEKKQNP